MGVSKCLLRSTTAPGTYELLDMSKSLQSSLIHQKLRFPLYGENVDSENKFDSGFKIVFEMEAGVQIWFPGPPCNVQSGGSSPRSRKRERGLCHHDGGSAVWANV